MTSLHLTTKQTTTTTQQITNNNSEKKTKSTNTYHTLNLAFFETKHLNALSN
jgi:hypothetical protein